MGKIIKKNNSAKTSNAESASLRHCEARETKRVQRSNSQNLRAKRSNHPKT
ncbi:hypothetical protein ACWIUD_06975 [Helicobacter sp. 23-1044]